MDILSILGGLWRLLLDPVTLLYVVIGAQAGILFGMMPGLTTTTALSLLTGLTFSLAPEKAIAVVRETQKASTSLIQRRLRIGYPRAARLMDELEELGVVGPNQGGGREREVLISPEDEVNET